MAPNGFQEGTRLRSKTPKIKTHPVVSLCFGGNKIDQNGTNFVDYFLVFNGLCSQEFLKSPWWEKALSASLYFKEWWQKKTPSDLPFMHACAINLDFGKKTFYAERSAFPIDDLGNLILD